MKSIAYIVPYFGKLPEFFNVWLMGCKENKTIDWFIFTDDRREFDYPANVIVTYCSFEEIRLRIQEKFSFKITLDRPYKLCDYRVAYGDIFRAELKEYDFWGYCDIDVLFGDIRAFINDDILDRYEKIGYQGHSTLYKNIESVRKRYLTKVSEIRNYKEIYTTSESCFFDENVFSEMYNKLEIPYYKEVNFAHLEKYDPNFYLGHFPREMGYKNKCQIFIWKKGKLFRVYIVNEQLYLEEFMYIHFFCRPIKINVDEILSNNIFAIVPDKMFSINEMPNVDFVKRNAHRSKLIFYVKYIYRNRRKISVRKVIESVRLQIKYKEKVIK